MNKFTKQSFKSFSRGLLLLNMIASVGCGKVMSEFSTPESNNNESATPHTGNPPFVEAIIQTAASSISWTQLKYTNPNSVFTSKEVLIPAGAAYVDSVPDTLDLADMSRDYIIGMTNSLMKSQFYAPPGMIYYFGTPRMNPHDGVQNWGKSAQALIMARRISGYDLNDANGSLNIQYQSLKNMIDNNVNNIFIKNGDGAWIVEPQVNPSGTPDGLPTPMTTALEALIEIYQQHPEPQLNLLIKQMVNYHEQAHTLVQANGGPMMYYGQSLDANVMANYDSTYVGPFGWYLYPFVAGKAMRALTSWFNLTGDQNAFNSVAQLSNFTRNYNNSEFWQTHGNVPGGEGHFDGHMHGFLNATMGLIWQAEALQKTDPAAAASLIQFANKTYLFVRNYQDGAALGNFGEICTVGDMIRLALKLTDVGAGDYYDDVDRWLRNQIAEAQIRTNQIPSLPHSNDLFNNIGQRVQGLFFEDATHPFAIPTDTSKESGQAFQSVACGFGNPMMAIYDAWEHIVQITGSTAKINLPLNRASTYLDVTSELPYRGYVTVKTKATLGPVHNLSIRIPDWTVRANTVVYENGQVINSRASLNGAYVNISNIQPNTTYAVYFPIVTRTLKITQTKSQNQMWQESNINDPKHPFTYSTYTGLFRGNTFIALTDESLRPKGGVQLYQRQRLASLPPGDVILPPVTKYRFAPDMPGARTDLIAWNTASNQITLLPSTQDGLNGTSFAFGQLPATSFKTYFADITGDGKSDLIAWDLSTGKISVFPSKGTGISSSWFNLGQVGSNCLLYFADITGDGRADLITWDKLTGNITGLPSAGTGLTGAWFNFGRVGSNASLHFADVTGDRKADLITWDSLSGDITAFPSSGSGLSSSWFNFGKLPSYFEILLGDIDADGKADLVFRNLRSNQITAGKSNGNGLSSFVEFGALPAHFKIYVADTSGDGRADLHGWDYSSGQITTWQSSGNGLKGSSIALGKYPSTSYQINFAEANGN